MKALTLALLVPLLCHAVDPAAPTPAAPTAPAKPAMQEISPGVFQIGAIRIDQKARTAVFPAKVNMTLGNLEYLLVHSTGATHESLLATDVQPADLHFSMLLLGAKSGGATAPAGEDAPPAQINREALALAPKLSGDAIRISVKWKAGNEEKVLPVEDWILDFDKKKPAPRGPWLYTGSMFRGQRFIAQAEGAFAALVTYPGALINNPRPGADNDLIWGPNAKIMPPVETPVEITITLDPQPTSPK